MSEDNTTAMLDVAGERRLRQLEALFLGGPVVAKGQSFSIETLLDVLIVLYDECCNSSLRKEKTVSNFIEFGEYYLFNIRNTNRSETHKQYPQNAPNQTNKEEK